MDKTVGLWKGNEENVRRPLRKLKNASRNIFSFQYEKFISLVGHQNSVTTVSGFQSDSTGDIFVASGSADSTVKLWRIHTSGSNVRSANCFHTIDFKTGFAITLELVPVEIFPSVFLLFVATDKNKVHVYQVTDDTVGEVRFISLGKTCSFRSIWSLFSVVMRIGFERLPLRKTVGPARMTDSLFAG